MDIDTQAVTFPGQIHLITHDRDLDAISDRLQSATQLGFDTETRPSFRKGEVFRVALLQLSTETDAFLFRLHTLTRFEPIKNILENKAVLKVGAAIRDDLKQLQKIFQFGPENFVELQDVAKRKGLQNFGLQGMTEEVLQLRLSKRRKLTNWEARELTDEQLIYAATDAWIGLRLFKKLAET